ncbi:MAG: DUF1553 domain-containing protein [Cyclobacteriaceae bacterium]
MDIPKDVNLAYEELPQVLDYNIDVKPILSDRCYHCHGPDVETRSADMRLDTKDDLFAKTKSGNRPFVSGNLKKSAVIERILSDDPEFMMPPPESNRSLSAEEKAMLVKWVEDGAEWKEHWAYITPEKKTPPKTDKDWPVANEIDAFIYAKLVQNKLTPSTQANKEQLLRRVTMDLTGLPPSLDEQEAFLEDNSNSAYEKVVDRLLTTKAYAERMTLEWLDLSRYADSHGLHGDGIRTAWPWRDWVIEAFYKNMPYDQFVIEQLAGDMIPNAKKDQIIATAFNRNHPMTGEGGVVDEEFRLEYVSNRTNTFGTAFLGLTLECAKCHDHKFDPISQKEYYQVSSFFNNIKELGMTGDDGDYGPVEIITDDKIDELLTFLSTDIEQSEAKLQSEKERISKITGRQTKKLSPVVYHSFETSTKTKDLTYADNSKRTEQKGDVEFKDGVSGRAPVFDQHEDHFQIQDIGLVEAHQPFSVALWVNPNEIGEKTQVLAGNAGNKNEYWRGWDFYLDSTNHVAFRLISNLPHNYLHFRSQKVIPKGKWSHVMATYDGSMSTSGTKIFIDGKKDNGQVLFNRLGKSILPITHQRDMAEKPLRIGKSYRSFTGDNGIFKGQIDELAFFDFEVPEDQIAQVKESSKLGNKPSVDVNTSNTLEEISKLLAEQRLKRIKMLDTIPELMVMEEMATTRDTYVLDRGEYDKPKEKVDAGTIDKVLPFDSKYPTNRLGLSQWLFDEGNPLTARVAVNRYWQMIFGKGIVATVNDFGSQGALPSHLGLLDWLAVDFRESGWDVKKLIKTMVMSNTYKQSSEINEELYEKDPSNTWLARGPSYRWQAEFIRDNALAASGLLNEKIGGESVRPYQPKGLWIELASFSHALYNYIPDRDDRQYRRSMYTFIRRTSPPPFMTLFDAPNRSMCTVSRERTNTPLQALVLLNDPQFVEASRALACRLKKESKGSLDKMVENGFRLVLGRKPSADEFRIMKDLYAKEVENFKSDIKGAKEYLSVGDFKAPENEDPVELAALAVVSNTLLNMDEAYTKR